MPPLPDPEQLIERIRLETWRRNASYRELVERAALDGDAALPEPALDAQLAGLEARIAGGERTPGALLRFPFRRMKWLHRLVARLERWLLLPLRQALETQLAVDRALLAWARSASRHLERKHAHVIALEREIARLDEQLVLARLQAAGTRRAATDGPGATAPPTAPVVALPADIDALYLDFEDRFRGPAETVKRRLSVYLDLLRDDALPAGAAALDIGCGRGEWLELVAESGWSGKGVDANAAAAALCRRRGLAVDCADAFAYLAGLADGRLHIVSAFHVVEHLDFAQSLRLLDEIHRVLAPGGVMLLETPNPCNVMVGACDFHRDPTHLRPVHPDTLMFLARARGFADARAWFFEDTAEGPPRAIDSADYVFGGLESYLWISRDYGLVAHKRQTPCA